MFRLFPRPDAFTTPTHFDDDVHVSSKSRWSLLNNVASLSDRWTRPSFRQSDLWEKYIERFANVSGHTYDDRL